MDPTDNDRTKERHLAAIMFTDIVGYTAMMQQSEHRTLRLIGRHRQALEACTAKQEGRVIQYYGDGSLSLYPSAVQAVRCALNIQELVADEPAVPLRIGLHMGEVLEIGGDVYGNGINLTARIQAEGVAGSVLISEKLYEEIRHQGEFQTSCLGVFELKNIAEPVTIHALTNGHLAVPEGPTHGDQKGNQVSDTPHNLPSLLTSFIGRQPELDQLRHYIKVHRLCTLVGMGGIGKTRLAVELGKSLLSEFPEGVYFIDLVPVPAGSPEKIANACLEALQLEGEMEQSSAQILTDHIKGRNILLILDNCEHLIDESTRLVQHLLKHTEAPHLLVTSRERLNVSGEQVWPLDTLSLPPPGLKREGGDFREYEAIQLFVDRAWLVAPGFRPEGKDWEFLMEICRFLDGIPLAIELAAARIRTFSPEILLERLKKVSGLLHSRERNTAPRQQTMERLVDWSYQLLSPQEQILFQRLSVFADTFDLQGAEAVCAAPPLPDDDVPDLLELLIDKSLVLPVTGNRYRLLEVVKQFGRKKSQEANQWEDLSGRFFQYYLDLAAQAYQEQITATEKWMAKLQAEHENLIHALECVRDQPGNQLDLASLLWWYWNIHFHKYKAGTDYLKMGIENYRSRDLIRGRALVAFGKLSFLQNDLEARLWFEEAIDILKNLEASRELATAFLELGAFYASTDNFEKGDEALRQCVRIAEELGDLGFLVRARSWACYGYVTQYQAEQAEPILEQNLELAIQQEMTWDVLMNSHLYADCALIQERYNIALERYKKAFLAGLAVGDQLQVAYELQGLAMSMAGMGQHQSALMLKGAAEQKFEDLGLSPHPAMWWDRLLEKHLGKARMAQGEEKATALELQGKARPFREIAERIREGDMSFFTGN